MFSFLCLHYLPCIVRVSTVYHPYIVRVSTVGRCRGDTGDMQVDNRKSPGRRAVRTGNKHEIVQEKATHITFSVGREVVLSV